MIRTRRKPYFAMVQSDLTSMDPDNAPGTDSLVTISVELAVESLPVKATSDNEHHIIACYLDTANQANPLVYIGLTPIGKIAGGYYDNSGLTMVTFETERQALTSSLQQTTIGLVATSGTTGLYLNGQPLALSTTPDPFYTVTPTSYGMFMLFNGPTGLTRAGLMVDSVSFLFGGAVGRQGSITWRLDENRGEEAFGDPGTGFDGCDFTVKAQNWIGSAPWGNYPINSLADLYGWRLATDWTERALPSTNWTRMGE